MQQQYLLNANCLYYCDQEIVICVASLILIPEGRLSQMLAALCDINQTHLCGNTSIQHMHPSLLYTSGEDLSFCSDKNKNPIIRNAVKHPLCQNCSEYAGVNQKSKKSLNSFELCHLRNE